MATVASEAVEQQTTTMNGAEILVECLVRHDADYMFAYPGGCSMPLHQALLKAKDQLRTILPRHEQGGGFAAQGVARSTGKVGVCMATSGPGATNLVTSIADAKLDSIPMVAVTGQVPQNVIGSDAFQETPMVEVSRAITKHHYMITDINDVARIVKEAFHIAATGRPGPVLIDFPKDVQLAELPTSEIDFDPPMNLPGYHPISNGPHPDQVRQILAAIRRSKKPILYVGGGCVNSDAAEELTNFAHRTGIPVTTTVMGIGAFPAEDPQSLHMLGMHGTVYANYATNDADLLLALGVRFDDRVTGKLEEFAKHGKIVHVDLDASEIHKNKEAHIPVIADVKKTLQALNAMIEDEDIPEISEWTKQVQTWKKQHPLSYGDYDDAILQQYAIERVYQLTKEQDPYVAVGVGQHQMWAAQFFKFNKPRRWLSSSGLGTMGFGLPAAMGVAAVKSDELVIDIDGDGSFQMNIQELATLRCENLPVKILLLNNQHLGMVVQWEDRFMEGRRAHTYLGHKDDPEAAGAGDGMVTGETYPDFVTIAAGYGIPGAHVRKKSEFDAAVKKMLETDGPYLLDVICPYQEHVLPMIPSGKTVRDIITE
ncbi:biosynthetic-type acetolactate synthase large subunit [Calycomorphotria hydatis]|uniref:Acetolactate synthase n=1 Tax=Calycomorphotria hydatis TaxID=2528027 RepID=A0A517TB16_9PLAN|nr:biosynthetic-type acetolactate synthase large subunit [Calycomorphotria hydatis]QDT65572.1 Acetolactate synthase large subunit [Calycomorphotria hydatis]